MNEGIIDSSSHPNSSLLTNKGLQTLLPPSDRPNMELYTSFPQSVNYLPAQNSPTDSLFDDVSPHYPLVADGDMLEYNYPGYGASLGQHAVEYPDAFVQRAADAQTVSMSQNMPPRSKMSPLYPSQEWQRPSIFVQANGVESLSSDSSGSNTFDLSRFDTHSRGPGKVSSKDQHPRCAAVPSSDDSPNNMMSPFSSPFANVGPASLDRTQQRRSPQAVSERPSGTVPTRPGMYMSTSCPNTYGTLDFPTSMTTTTSHSSSPAIQAQTAFPQQRQDEPIPVSMPMPMRLYSHPTMYFNGATSSSDAGSISSGPDFSPMIAFRQMNVEDGQGSCNPQYVNGNMSGGDDDGGDIRGYETSGSEGSAVKKIAKTAGNRSALVDGWAHESDLWDDDYAEGDDEDDGDYEEIDEDDDDGEYIISSKRSFTSGNTHNLRQRRRSSTNAASSRYHPYPDSGDTTGPHSPVLTGSSTMPLPKTRMGRQANLLPIPVPNLTKKSRGRRVPTVDSLRSGDNHRKGSSRRDKNEGECKNPRTFVCDMVGCGKCFARGEHLKRHIRSIHTHEKPHTCPHPDCDKGFSRYDNLRQHLRVHKGYVLDVADKGNDFAIYE